MREKAHQQNSVNSCHTITLETCLASLIMARCRTLTACQAAHFCKKFGKGCCSTQSIPGCTTPSILGLGISKTGTIPSQMQLGISFMIGGKFFQECFPTLGKIGGGLTWTHFCIQASPIG